MNIKNTLRLLTKCPWIICNRKYLFINVNNNNLKQWESNGNKRKTTETITTNQQSFNHAIRNYVTKYHFAKNIASCVFAKIGWLWRSGSWSSDTSYPKWFVVRQSQCRQSCEIARRRSRKYAPDYADRSSHVLALSAFEEGPSSEKARALRLHRRHVLHFRLQRGDQWEGKRNDILSRFILRVHMDETLLYVLMTLNQLLYKIFVEHLYFWYMNNFHY